MRREAIRILVCVLLLGLGAADRGASIRGPHGLDTVIRELPRRVIDVRQMVEAVGQQCGLEVVVDQKVSGDLSVERLPATARSILREALPPKGFLYLTEGETLRVMTEPDLWMYFRSHAVSRSYDVQLTSDLMRRLLETPDVVSTMGYLGVDPERGVVKLHDLPCFVRRVEEILVASSGQEALITL
jgi:type II secretory pathway component GspD/PulD (secretin)